jgi:hypothetical protein
MSHKIRFGTPNVPAVIKSLKKDVCDNAYEYFDFHAVTVNF